MKVYGLALVKDEADVVGECIRHALGFCDVVAVLDNGSEDGSADVIEQLVAEHPDRVRSYGVEHRPYVLDLRRDMYDDLHRDLSADDWFLQLDVDEFLVGDPRPTLARATADGFNQVATWQAQFQFTDVDLADWEAGRDDPALSIIDRRRYYRVEWREGRFWRNDPAQAWTGQDRNLPDFADRLARYSLVNRHYQLRDPDQIAKRLANRVKAKTDTAFAHVTSTDWRSEVVPAKGLRYWEPGSTPRPWPWRYYLTMAKARVGR